MELTRRALLHAGLAAGAAGLVAACSSDSTTSSGRRVGAGRRVNKTGQPIASAAMVGDSITAGSIPQLQFAFASEGVEFVVDAQSGRRISAGRADREPTPGLFALQSLLNAGNAPDLWIIALGTNDIGSLAGPEDTAGLIDSLLAMLPDGNPLTWIDCYRPQIPDQMDMFNLVLRDRLAQRGNATVASWVAKVTEPDVDYLVDDRIHPNAAGTQAFAEVAITALVR